MAEKKKISKKMPKIVYTPEEEDWLITNVMEYRSIIENKKTDGATNRDKERAWEQIAKAFNEAPPCRERAVKSLREKYQKIKQTLKDRAYYFSKQTGGGPPKKELPALSEPMLQLAKIIMSSTISLAATTGDSDNKIANYCSTADVVTTVETPIDQLVPLVQKDREEMFSDESAVDERTWERVNRTKLRKPTNFVLQNRRRKTELQTKNKILTTTSEFAHLAKMYKIEIEILEMERERYKFERERAELDRDRAALDLERSAVELERSKAQLVHDKEFQRLRLAGLSKENGSVPVRHTSVPCSLETTTLFPTAAVKEEYLCD